MCITSDVPTCHPSESGLHCLAVKTFAELLVVGWGDIPSPEISGPCVKRWGSSAVDVVDNVVGG